MRTSSAWIALLLLAPFRLAGAMQSPSAAPAFADVFGSGMVLPHDTPVVLSGTAAPRQRLTLQLGSSSYSTQSDSNGQWRATLAPLRAGGPYEISLRDASGAGATLTDVLAGEVWLCSGQSNMEFPAVRSTDQPEAAMQGHPGIRLLQVAQRTAVGPRADFEVKPRWQVADARSIPRFSAVCYFFAFNRIAEDGIPIGLINASWGGSSIEPWIREEQLARWPAYRRRVELLQIYRRDPRAAAVSFSGDWVSWWQSHSSLGPVWERGVLDAAGGWQDAPLRDWRTYPDPRLANFTGNLWYSNTVQLTEAQARKGASFVLGKVDEVDTTWLNGRFVGNTFGYGTRREYRLDPGMLRAGENQFSVFVTSTYDAGGLYGPDSDMGIRFDDGEFIALGTGWKYRFVPKETGYPPRAPWESVSGITGMFNGMIAPLRPLPPTGVIWYQGESNVDKGDYAQLLPGLIHDWRQFFGRELPFIVVQLPNYGAVTQAPAESQWARLRNTQQQVSLRDGKVGLVATQDLGDDGDIHPRRKFIVAQRALRVARALESGGARSGVVPRLAGTSAQQLQLDFAPPLTVNAQERPVAGFALCAAAEGSCVPARAVQSGNQVRIDRAALPAATRVRYCWSDGGVCELKSLAGLPVGSFELNLGAGAARAQ